MPIDITVKGFNALVRKVSKGPFDNSAKRQIQETVGANLLGRQRERFLRAVDPTGVPWPVSAAALRRARTGRGGRTLYDTGTLFNSIQYGYVSPDVGKIGTDVPYARKHQLGEEGMVKRVFLGFTQEDADAASVIASAITSKLLNG